METGTAFNLVEHTRQKYKQNETALDNAQITLHNIRRCDHRLAIYKEPERIFILAMAKARLIDRYNKQIKSALIN